MLLIMHLALRSRLISSQKAIRLMLQQYQREKDSRVLLRRMVSTEDLWHTVPSSTVIRVLMAQVQILAVYSRARVCLVTWAA